MTSSETLRLPAGEDAYGAEQSSERRIAELVEAIRKTDQRLIADQEFDVTRTISVFGERGMGKTTLLRLARRQLSETNLVLPVVDPARFSPEDSLLGWILADLARILEPAALEVETQVGITVQRLLTDLTRSEALSTGSYSRGLSNRGLSPEEFGRDVSSVTLRRAQLSDYWSALVEAVMQSRVYSGKQLVISIDDADLHPEVLSSLVADIGILTSTRYVVVILASDEKTLRHSLLLSSLEGVVPQATYARNAGLTPPSHFSLLAARRLDKYFPRSYRVTLSPLRQSEVLKFTPIGRQKSMNTLLDEFAMPNDPSRSVLDYFVLRSTGGAVVAETQYVGVLPSNRRELRDLYDSIDLMDRSTTSAGQVLQQIIERALLSASSTHDLDKTVVIEPSSTERSAEVTFNFEGITTGRSLSAGQLIYKKSVEGDSVGSAAIYSRLLTEQYIILGGEAGTHPSSSSEEEASPTTPADYDNRLPDRATLGIMLAWDTSFSKGYWGQCFGLVGFTGTGIVTPGLRNWQDLVAPGGIGRRSVCYWTVPDWDQWYRYSTVIEAWRRIRRWIGLLKEEQLDAGLLERLYLAHLEIVATVQLYDAVPDWLAGPADVFPPELSAGGARRKSLVARQAEVKDLLVKACGAVTQPGFGDYEVWAVGGLTLGSVALCTTERMGEWSIELRDSLPVSREAKRIGANLVFSEINSHISEDRSRAELASFATLDQSQASSLSSIHDAVRNTKVAERNQVLATLEKANVPAEILARLQDEGSTPEVLSSLAALSWSPNNLVMISTIFPPIPGGTTELHGALV